MLLPSSCLFSGSERPVVSGAMSGAGKCRRCWRHFRVRQQLAHLCRTSSDYATHTVGGQADPFGLRSSTGGYRVWTDRRRPATVKLTGDPVRLVQPKFLVGGFTAAYVESDRSMDLTSVSAALETLYCFATLLKSILEDASVRCFPYSTRNSAASITAGKLEARIALSEDRFEEPYSEPSGT